MQRNRVNWALGLCLLWLALGGVLATPAANAWAETAEPEPPLTLANAATGEPLDAFPLDEGQFLPGVAPDYATSRYIDVNISRQRITAYLNGRAVRSALVSTGTRAHPTVVGRFRVYRKVHAQTMSGGSRAAGDYYRLPGVPHVMYFYSGYAIHGTYWHRNFGHPMSHGCVNLTLADADWFYSWAPVGTLVVTHY